MRVERVSNEEFKIFLTFDDLIDRGFTKDDIWQDLQSVKSLFSDMMHEASTELGLELEGVLLVQVHLMQAQGMHVFVTQKSEEEDDWFDDFIEMKVTLDESEELIFMFEEFEDFIQASKYLDRKNIKSGKLYFKNEKFYYTLAQTEFDEADRESVIAILAEFANPSILTQHRLEAYGKVIMDTDAIAKAMHYFN